MFLWMRQVYPENDEVFHINTNIHFQFVFCKERLVESN